MPGDETILQSFDGLARLFPLPNLVLYPHVIQGLHLFEPRYRQLAEDSIAADDLFAMALYDPDAGGSALCEYACLGHIQQHEKQPDGRYHMRLRGLRRVRIKSEVESNRLYRIARVDVVAEDRPDDLPRLTKARRQLSGAVLARIESGTETYRNLEELFRGEMPLGHVCDLLAYALPFAITFKYRMLATPLVWDRCELLMNELGSPPVRMRVFPPTFSSN